MTSIRSLLVVPASQGISLGEELFGEADAVVVDLAGADQRMREDAARAISTLRGSARRPTILVRSGPLASSEAARDVATLAPARPHGFLAAGLGSAADLQHLGAMLAVEEARIGLPDNAFRIIATVETGGALFGLGEFGRAGGRLDALGWDGEALARDLGAEVARDEDGGWCDPCQTARTLTLAAAADAELAAIDAVFAGASPEAFRRDAERARRDGFSAKFALDADQVRIVNEVFARAGE